MKILHVPYTFAPDAMGGTEYYVQALAQQSKALGYEVAIAAPGARESSYQIDGIDVYRFPSAAPADAAYGAEDQVAAEAFQRIVSRMRPDIVHLHAYSSAVSARLLAAAKSASAATIFHLPHADCQLLQRDHDGVREDAMRWRSAAPALLRLHFRGPWRWIGLGGPGLSNSSSDRSCCRLSWSKTQALAWCSHAGFGGRWPSPI
jgi:glycosyltransferase involved in cell wall biosynthesis